MKRPRTPENDAVLSQLHALTNGGALAGDALTNGGALADAASATQLPVADPVLAQLDALINPHEAAPPLWPPLALLSPCGLLLPTPEALPSLRSPSWRHAGLLREFGGVRAWMATRGR